VFLTARTGHILYHIDNVRDRAVMALAEEGWDCGRFSVNCLSIGLTEGARKGGHRWVRDLIDAVVTRAH
jgi:hypothetical protein